ncbi:MAG: hypothetical protein OXF54_06030 [Caldilineaceae bacterium]|nr:hypothetical protein [Caldilineaceae bacterium]
MLPHIAHLVGAGKKQKVLSVDKTADYLARNEDIRMILFCDDFAGTGKQITSHLIEVLAGDELLRKTCKRRCQNGNPVILGIVLGVGFDSALRKIRTSGPVWLPIMAHAGAQLGEQDRAFSKSSQVFPEPELRAWAENLVVDRVGKHLWRKWPGGFDDAQALVVTADNVPNNTLPAICRSGPVGDVEWQALFERVPTPSS